MASDLTTVAFIYKRLYSDKQAGDLAMRDHPLFSMMKKEGGFTGSAFYYPIRYGNPQGISGSLSTAQTNTENSRGVQMAANRKAKFAVITLDGEAMAAADGKPGAFLDLVRLETDGVLEEVGDHLSHDLYKNGVGIRGQRSSESADVTTLVVADDARNFKVGMVVGASANADLSSPRTGTTAILSVDEDNGKIGLDTSAITSYADNDYLFVAGTTDTCMEGLASHLPLTAPTSGDSFRGVDRSVHVNLLAGSRVDNTSAAIEENAGLVATKISQVGKKADSVFVNPINFWQVARRLNAKVEYAGGGGKADYGFEFISIHSSAGTLRMYADPDCPTNRGYVLNMSSWYIKHLMGLPHIIKDDGRPSLRRASADGIEARVRSWCNPICTMPGANGVFSI